MSGTLKSGSSQSALIGVLIVFVTMSAHSARAVTIDLTTGTAGNVNSLSGALNGRMLAAEVDVLSSADLMVRTLTLPNVEHRIAATLDATIWEVMMVGLNISGSQVGIAQASITSDQVGLTQDLVFTFSTPPALESGKRYRIGVFMPASGSSTVNRIDLFVPSGVPPFPWTESTGMLQIRNAFEASSSTFPTTSRQNFPVMKLDVIPEPASGILALVALGVLLGCRRRSERTGGSSRALPKAHYRHDSAGNKRNN